MVRHHNLRAIRYENPRLRHAPIHNPLDLPAEIRNIQRNAVADNACRVSVKYAGRQQMKRKFSVLVDNRVSCVAASLKANNDVRGFPEHVGDFSLSLVPPVCSYNCSYHNPSSSLMPAMEHEHFRCRHGNGRPHTFFQTAHRKQKAL